MNRILSIMVAFLLMIISVQAQQNDSRNVKKHKRPSGNPGDPRNSRAAQPDSLSKDDRNNLTVPTGKETEILGEENNNSPSAEDIDGSNNYRNKRLKGNPNNRNVNEGSNNQTTDGETTESPNADGNNIMENGPSNENSGVVRQQETSGSGSPSILSGEEGNERDGTNNVQRAKPNMAGSPVNGIHMPRKNDFNRKKLKKASELPKKVNKAGQQNSVNPDPYLDDVTYQKQMEDQMKEATSVESAKETTKSENKKNKKSSKKKSKSRS